MFEALGRSVPYVSVDVSAILSLTCKNILVGNAMTRTFCGYHPLNIMEGGFV